MKITAIERSGSTQDHYWRAAFGQPSEGATLESLIQEGDELIERPDLIGATQVPHTRIVQIKSASGIYAGSTGRFYAVHTKKTKTTSPKNRIINGMQCEREKHGLWAVMKTRAGVKTGRVTFRGTVREIQAI